MVIIPTNYILVSYFITVVACLVEAGYSMSIYWWFYVPPDEIREDKLKSEQVKVRRQQAVRTMDSKLGNIN